MTILPTLAVALVATILIELGCLWLLGERRKTILGSSVVVNILTNIPLNAYLLLVGNGTVEMIIGELLVVLVETLWYYAFIRKIGQAFVYSVLCNAISFLIGVLFQLLLLLCELE